MEQCGKEGTDFLCFPEGYLSNYSADLAVSLDDPRVEQLARASRRHDMVTVVGLSEKEAGQVLNTALVLYRGAMLGKYRKTMLTGSDKKVFASDYGLPVFEAKGIPFGVIICHDSSFVEPALTMRWMGARLLFSPHYNSISSDRMDEHRIKVRNNHIGLATLLQMVVVRSNVVGWKEDRLGYGDSAIFSPLGEVVAAAPLFQETLISAEFEKGVFKDQRWARREEIPLPVLEQLWQAGRSCFPENGDT
jgi:predicted amidohydrolase